MSNSRCNPSSWEAVETFYRREILLLQDHRYREWLGLMDPAIRYWVPVTTSTLQGLQIHDNEIGYYDENYELLEARVAKLESRQSWVEQPPSRVRYFVQLIDIETLEDGALSARSNLMLLQYRWNMEQQFSGERSDTLIHAEGELRLKSRRVILDRRAIGNQGLSVFF
jgi:3-phenylpropionate/cinnamic acid dioxygenase small subunit